MMKGMPEFETEEEFNKFFEKETAYCNQFRDETGMMCFESEEQFREFLDTLFKINDDGTRVTYELHED